MVYDHQNLGQPLKIGTKLQASSFEIIKFKTWASVQKYMEFI